jgi:hypothetical protein
MAARVVTRYLVAVRRGNGQMERAPEPVDAVAFFSLLRRLKPFQELHVAVVTDPPGQERTL